MRLQVPTPGTGQTRSAFKDMNIVVTLSDQAVADAGQLSRQLKKSGMTIETQLESIGQYIGTSSPADLPRLKAVKSVANVEELGEVHLPPSPLDPQ
ncbi:MAG: hypothetical protein WKF77_00095 [Planctomycetaceae bacterium]